MPGDQFTAYCSSFHDTASSSVGVYEPRLEPYHHTIIIIPTCQYMPNANVPYVTVTTHYWQFTHQRIATSPYTPYTYNITLHRITTFAHFLKCSAALSWQTIDCYILADLAIIILYSVITTLQCCRVAINPVNITSWSLLINQKCVFKYFILSCKRFRPLILVSHHYHWHWDLHGTQPNNNDFNNLLSMQWI